MKIVFKKKTCERCEKQYRMRTISENRGRFLCHDCIKHCSECGNKLPKAHWFGQSCSITTGLLGTPNAKRTEYQEKPWIGSGMCMDCYRAKEDREREEQLLIKKAQLAHAKETLETPSVWVCQYCRTVNRGRFCSNCGASRKQEVRELIK